MRLTKIIATIGPSCNNEESLIDLFNSGVDITRLNFSHGSYDEHKKTLDMIRIASSRANKHIGILQDLSGPKIRIGIIKDKLILNDGDEVVFCYDENLDGSNNRVHVNYKLLHKEVTKKERIFLADGFLEVEVQQVIDEKIHTKVISGGILTSRKGMNLPDTKLSQPSLTEKDKKDVAFGLEIGVEMMALSFVRDPKDIDELRKFMEQKGKIVPIIAKIEKPEALKNIDEIINIADGIMIARGDLAIETPMEKVPIIQKEIIQKVRLAQKPVIVATQMLESMIEDELPTRAEVTDVANAVFDGAGAVMLSGETAVGKHPKRVVNQMVKIIKEAEKTAYTSHDEKKIDIKKFDVELSVASSAATMANSLNAKAVFALTLSGRSAELLSSQRLPLPIIAFSPSNTILNKLALCFGVYSVRIKLYDQFKEVIDECVRRAKEVKIVKPGDYVVITSGHPFEEKTNTNLVHALKIP